MADNKSSGAGGYDVSPATSRANAQAANQEAGTYVNFGSGFITPNNSFTAEPTATATTSAKGPASSNVTPPNNSSSGASSEQILIFLSVASLAVSVFAAIYISHKK